MLRYCRWEGGKGSLCMSRQWLDSRHERHSQVESCTGCGGRRQFEFQVLPQLLHFLQVDRLTDVNVRNTDGNRASIGQEGSCFTNQKQWDIDWGTIDVFTCTSSCSAANSCYFEEVVIIQPPPNNS